MWGRSAIPAGSVDLKADPRRRHCLPRGAFWIFLKPRPITRRQSQSRLPDRSRRLRGVDPLVERPTEDAMSGHSQFKNIMHRKGRQDAVRSKMFSKLAREITVAAKTGTPDPAMNPRLRLAVQNAKAVSMPKDNIQRAINKASMGDAENYEAVRYEGYGPGGVALIVEALTDNRNRSASNVRAAFTKAGGAMGETGSVSFMWDRVGEIYYP